MCLYTVHVSPLKYMFHPVLLSQYLFLEANTLWCNARTRASSPSRDTQYTMASYSDPSRKHLAPIIIQARSPSNSSSTRTVYSSSDSSSRSSSAGYHQPSSGYQQSSTRATAGYHSSYSDTPGVQKYRVSTTGKLGQNALSFGTDH